MTHSSDRSDRYHRSSSSTATTGIGANGRLHVDHTYRDFSRYLQNGGQTVEHKKSGANFPANLHRMLSEPKNSHIITWMPHGRAFKILSKELLVTVAIPEYFSLTKFESFTRQLSGWGYKRLHRQGADYGCYYHESFLRGIPQLTVLMTRVTSKHGKCVPYPEGEPNFYLISRLHPLPPTTVLTNHKESRPEEGTVTAIHTSQSLPRIQAQNSSVAMGPLTSEAAPTQVASYHSSQPYYETRNIPGVQYPSQTRYLPAPMATPTFMDCQPPNPSNPTNYASTPMAVSNNITQYYGGPGHPSYSCEHWFEGEYEGLNTDGTIQEISEQVVTAVPLPHLRNFTNEEVQSNAIEIATMWHDCKYKTDALDSDAFNSLDATIQVASKKIYGEQEVRASQGQSQKKEPRWD